jgi:hypothetical protein
MKLKAYLTAACSLLVMGAAPLSAIADELPNTGTYFIVNASSQDALQPVGATVGQNVLLYPYNKSGMQKWTINRRIDPKTNKPTNRYTIKLAGDNGTLNLVPHPSVPDATALVTEDTSVYVLEPAASGLLIKSLSRNGDALFVHPQPPMNAEACFGPSDGTTKFCWNFIATD